MQKIGLLIDSTTLTRKDLNKYSFLKVAQLKVHFDGHHFDESEITKEEMQKRIDNGQHMMTSQPSPVDFLDQYEAFYNEGYTHVITILLSSKLSGTYQSALVAKSMIEFQLEVDVHSPNAASYSVALGVKKLAEMIESGSKFDDILERYFTLYEKPFTSFTLGDLMNLFRGGRLNKAQALLGKLLRVKPIIEMIEGKLVLVKKERTNKACVTLFINKIDGYAKEYEKVYLDIININMPEWGQKVFDIVKEKYENVEVHITDHVSPVFYSHLGNKGFGVGIIAE